MKRLTCILLMVCALVCYTAQAEASDLPETREGTLSIEGAEETVQLTLAQGEIGDYAIYYDAENYKFIPSSAQGAEATNAVDEIGSVHNDEDISYFSMLFTTVEGTAEENFNNMAEDLSNEALSDDLPSAFDGGISTMNGDTYVLTLWKNLDDGKTLQVEVIMQTESLEGHGARAEVMLDTLTAK